MEKDNKYLLKLHSLPSKYVSEDAKVFVYKRRNSIFWKILEKQFFKACSWNKDN